MSKTIKLTSLTKSSGCAAKIGPAVLDSVLNNLPKFEDSNLLVGFDKKDDACVYKISDDKVSIQTVDFFPPMVDDPYTFGQIAATNALSDIYAMGGDPAIAMNLLCFPSCLDPSLMHDILSGGYSKIAEAGAVVAGVLEPPSKEPCQIGDDALIGANAVILEGVKIGAGAVVAAGSVVTEDVPAGVVVAGSPARIIKNVDDKTKDKTQILDDLRK